MTDGKDTEDHAANKTRFLHCVSLHMSPLPHHSPHSAVNFEGQGAAVGCGIHGSARSDEPLHDSDVTSECRNVQRCRTSAAASRIKRTIVGDVCEDHQDYQLI